ncbi:MAG: GT-D fold domain-containing protein [Butyrivibrio sp.]|nr:GT-D fold domain-containing protein [Butyrivibrio sp.]
MGQNLDDELLSELEVLQKENEALKEGQAQINLAIKKLLDIIQEQERSLRAVDRLSFVNRIRLESLPYEMQDKSYVSPIFYPMVMEPSDTVDKVVRGKSIGRFGDGEFGIIAGVKRWNFQSESDYLSKRLVEVLRSEEEGFLVGINPTFYINLESMPEVNADAIREYMWPDVRRFHAELLDPDRVYADALAFFIKTDEEYRSVKRLWDNRDITIIEGEYTRMGVGNDLYDSCRSIRRILCPAENAIDRYDEILETALKESKDRLILIALGPTATVLAYDLFKAGFQAVDIGHIDLNYEMMLRNVDRMDYLAIPYKYCNADEAADTKRDIPDVNDEVYLSEIVARIV